MSQGNITLPQSQPQPEQLATARSDVPPTAPPLAVDFFYSLGTLGRSAIGFVVSSWLLYFYVPPGGDPLIPVALYGVAILAGRVTGAALAPLIGYLSDNCQSRWGRRLPFMLLAGLPVALFFVLLWTPPVQGQSVWNILYLAVLFVLFRAALGLYQVPYEALLPEIATTEKHRVRISAWQSGFLLIGMVVGGIAGMTIENLGYPAMALIFGGLALVAFYAPLVALRERTDQQPAAREHPLTNREDFARSLAITWRNRTFMHFAVAWAIYLMTTSLVQSAAPFIVTEVCRLSTADTIYFYIPGLIASLACYPLVTRLAGHWGKGSVYAASFLAAALVFPGTFIIGDWLPISLKAQCITWSMMQSVAIAGLVVLTSAFIAEITDYDYAATGQRREGMYYATINVLEQVTAGAASLLLPVLLLLGRSQLSAQGPLGVRITGVVGGALMLIGFFIFMRYPLRRHSLTYKPN